VTRTAWQQQQAAMVDRISREAGELARGDWLRVRDRLLRDHAADQLSKRQVIDRLRTKYDKLGATYRRVTGTTYEGWLVHGPKDLWDELVAASHDDSVWDRLVDRVVQTEPALKPRGQKRARSVDATPAQVADVVRENASTVLMRDVLTRLGSACSDDEKSVQDMSNEIARLVREELERRAT
jgi:hypothetical protein